MLVLVSEGFGIHLLGEAHAGQPLHGILYQFDHLRWAGLTIWDISCPRSSSLLVQRCRSHWCAGASRSSPLE